MRKIWIFVQSDGLVSTFKFIWKSIVRKFYHQSRTFCLYVDREDVDIKRENVREAYHCKIITRKEELERIEFARLQLLPYRRWLENGSTVVVVFKNNVAVAFGWTHFRNHTIDYVGSFDMGAEIAWLGPSFVDYKHRGKGLQQWVIQQGVKSAPATIKAFITSINAGNVPSLRSFEKCGFKVGMEVRCKVGVITTRRREIEVLDGYSKDYLRIRE